MKGLKNYIKSVDIHKQDEQMLASLEAGSCYFHIQGSKNWVYDDAEVIRLSTRFECTSRLQRTLPLRAGGGEQSWS
jgi:hypothetical protein